MTSAKADCPYFPGLLLWTGRFLAALIALGGGGGGNRVPVNDSYDAAAISAIARAIVALWPPFLTNTARTR